jgi:single-strand DNA-binding protein
MGKTVNKTTLLGHVGKDPEIHVLQGDNTVANFTLATNDVYRDKMGESHETTEWHNLVAFGRTAEVVRDYVQKGSRIYVEGKLRTRSWDDRDSGQKKYRTEIVIRDLALLSFNNGNGNGAGYGGETGNGARQVQRSNAQQASDPDYAYAEQGGDPSDIPF